MKKFNLLLAALLLALAAGCNQQSTAPQSTTAVTEPGDVPAEVQAAYQKFAADDDELISALELATAGDGPGLSDTSYDLYAVTFLWGDFFGNPNTDPPTDWSGTAWVNAEAYLRVVHLIDFEPGEDSLVPDDRPAAVAWRSFTHNDLDGLGMLLFMKRGVVYIAPPVLTFDTPPIQLEFPVERLERLAAFFPVDHTGGVAVFAHKIRHRPCPHGTFEGRWVKLNNTETEGFFEGEWVDYNNEPVGVMSGEFWTDSTTGRGRLRGVLSGVITAQVIAELEGVWWFDDPRLCPQCGTGHGWFDGRFHFVNDDRYGRFAGEFGDWNQTTERELPMHGRWRVHCNHVASDFSNVGND